jgi:hypothetical protein
VVPVRVNVGVLDKVAAEAGKMPSELIKVEIASARKVFTYLFMMVLL